MADGHLPKRRTILVAAISLACAIGGCTASDSSATTTGGDSGITPSTTAAIEPATSGTNGTRPGSVVRVVDVVPLEPGGADRSGIDVWSNPNEATAIVLASDGSVWTTGPGGAVHWMPGTENAVVYTVDQGLTSNLGRAIVVDHEGSVYVAHGQPFVESGSGLSVFDGTSWVGDNATNGLPSDTVFDVAVGPDGTVWAATGGGIAFRSDGRWTALEGEDAAYDLAVGPDGTLRAATDAGVVVLGTPTDWERVPIDAPGDIEFPIAGAVTDADGGSWYPFWGVALVRSSVDGIAIHSIGEYLAEYLAEAESGSVASADLLPGAEWVQGAVVTRDGTVWMRGGPGLLRSGSNGWDRLEIEGLDRATLNDAVVGADGATWLATDIGLVRLDADGASTVFTLPTPTGNIVNDVESGPHGVVASWIAGRFPHENLSVGRFDGAAWADVWSGPLGRNELLLRPDTLGLDTGGEPIILVGTDYVLGDGSRISPSSPYERSLVWPTTDGVGTLWAHSGDGLWYLTESGWRVVDEPFDDAGSGSSEIIGIAPRVDAGVWLGTWDAGLFVAGAERIDSVDSTALNFRNVTAIEGGPDGAVWLAGNTEEGVELARWDGTEWMLVPVPPEAGPFERVTALEADADGAIWIGQGSEWQEGGPGAGIAKFDGERWSSLGSGMGLPSTNVFSIVMSDAGDVWVGTDGGIARIENPSSAMTVVSNEAAATSTTTLMSTTSITSGHGVPPVGYALDTTHPIEPRPLPGVDGAFGSGCSPGTGRLPDGVWFGWLVSFEADHIEFDVGCLRPTPEEPSPENTSTKIRSVAVEPGTIVYPIDDEGFGWVPIPYSDWPGPSAWCPPGPMSPGFPGGCLWWIYVNDGVATEMLEFWVA